MILKHSRDNPLITAYPIQVLNKVAGVYGLLSAFTGGTIGQLSFYIYSTASLAVLVWGMRAVSAVSRQGYAHP